MNKSPSPESLNKDIISSWEENATRWISVIENSKIDSRKFTDQAIVDTVSSAGVHKVLDVGCGEGWLCRHLSENGIEMTGIDANKQLLEYARAKGISDFFQLTFEEIIAGVPLPHGTYEGIVLNFCLYLQEENAMLLKKLKEGLSPEGKIFVQTIHPFFLLQNNLEYKSQWLADSWKGLDGGFVKGHQWFLRTFADWMTTANDSGLHVREIKETVNSSRVPVSLIMVLC